MVLYKHFLMFLLITLLTPTFPAMAMRCGNKIVSVGNTKAEVVLKCGEPFYRNIIAVKSIKVKTVRFSSKGQISKATTEEIEHGHTTKGPGIY